MTRRALVLVATLVLALATVGTPAAGTS